jgi:hypothetical protein
MDSRLQQARRNRLVAKLQEWVRKLQQDIAQLDMQIIVAMEEKLLHVADLQFHLQLLEELGRREII